jgi:hypothetical protein
LPLAGRMGRSCSSAGRCQPVDGVWGPAASAPVNVTVGRVLAALSQALRGYVCVKQWSWNYRCHTPAYMYDRTGLHFAGNHTHVGSSHNADKRHHHDYVIVWFPAASPYTVPCGERHREVTGGAKVQ